ncbi:sugar O-acetyltransferase [Enterococcus faecium]|nr:sugar O-acetyltransferase [Enterococcus faecium]
MTSAIEKQIVNKEIRVTDPLFEVIHQIQAENEEPLAALNTGYHEPADIRKRLEKIISDKVDDTVTVLLPFYTDFGKHISIGKNVFINRQAMFVDLGGICLEDSVLIGPRVNLITVNHLTDPTERRGLSVKPIHIKKNAWIGAGATILPGVTIGENAIVAANATVTKDVPDNTIVAGIPAKIVKPVERLFEE